MNNRTFTIVLYAVTILCAVLTIAHMIYAINAYQHSSIIEFVSREQWW